VGLKGSLDGLVELIRESIDSLLVVRKVALERAENVPGGIRNIGVGKRDPLENLSLLVLVLSAKRVVGDLGEDYAVSIIVWYGSMRVAMRVNVRYHFSTRKLFRQG
jgi:hypothetical protein